MSSDIVEVGNTLKLRQDTDPASKVTTWFRQGLNIVDIMPAHFILNLTGDNPSFSVYNTHSGTKGATDGPIDDFQKRCETYSLPKKKMVRLWLTGESTFQEEVSNEYQTNTIESMINGLMGSAVGSYANMFRSTTAGTGQNKLSEAATSSINSSIDSISKKTASLFGNTDIANGAANIVSSVGKTLTTALLNYKYLSVPKTYSGSSYNPALNFNVRLISPYGHPDAIQKFIVEPLTYLMLLAPPTTTDGVTYGNANYVSVRAYGIADIDLGIIENISIRRGGNDVAYNKYRQPLSIDVNLSIKPAAAGFAVQQNANATYKDKQYGANKVATDIATNNSVGSDDKLKSSMITLGNMLESFKPMPYPDAMGLRESPPVIEAALPISIADAANKKVSENTNNGSKVMGSILV